MMDRLQPWECTAPERARAQTLKLVLQALTLLSVTALLAGCASLSRQLLYSPDRAPVAADWIAQPPSTVAAQTAGGLDLKGYYWSGAAGDRDVIIFFHGRNWTASRSANFAQHLSGVGNAVLVASYRGFGDNPGKPKQSGMIEDAAAFIALANRLAGPDARIWLVGHSIGGAVALHMGNADPHVRGVIALSTFARMSKAVPRVARAFIADQWDNLDALNNLRKPVLLLQGARDRFIPEDSGDDLFSAYDGPASLILGEESRHNPDMTVLAPWLDQAISAMEHGSLADLPTPPAGWIEKVRRP